MNIFEQFKNPPKGYGIVPFYWWVGEKLTKEKIAWQLDQVKRNNFSGVQINYAHDYTGGHVYGLTLPSDPAIFTDAWWELVDWLVLEAEKREMTVSLSDYTLSGVGQNGYTDRILECRNDVHGYVLENVNGQYVPVKKEYSINPMHPDIGKLVVEHFFGLFERRYPTKMGKVINFFFSDELEFGVKGRLWSEDFSEEFVKRKGYDLMPHLADLFEDSGKTPAKTRLDYCDVMVQLQEERYFKPIFEWHEKFGMTFGCDHGGRGQDVTEFGDYFRTQKYNQGPGCDQPYLHANIIKNKVASSIANMYQRPRVWLEGFHSSQWDTSTEKLTDAIIRNYAMGHNLLSLHGMYYTTLGGWWEWAAPCNCFRMPYWKDMGVLTKAVERMSFLFSQGKHVSDIAIIYPVAAVEGGFDGDAAVQSAFAAGEALYQKGFDFDFIDFESILRAEIADGKLSIAGLHFKLVIVPAMRTVRYEMLLKLLAFSRAGGLVIALDCLPAYSDFSGTGMPLEQVVSELFGGIVYGTKDVVAVADGLIKEPHFRCGAVEKAYINHRRIEGKNFYMLYGIEKGTECFFRSQGTVSLWDMFSGERYELTKKKEVENGTVVTLPLEKFQWQVLCIEEDSPIIEKEFEYLGAPSTVIELKDTWEFELKPNLHNQFGDFFLPPSDEWIGAELRMAKGKDQGETMRFGYGPYFLKAGPFADDAALKRALDSALRKNFSAFSPYEFSMRYGVWDSPAANGYHGLKGRITNDFLGIGELKIGHRYLPDNAPFVHGENGESGAAFATCVRCEESGEYSVLTGELKPDALYIDGALVKKNEVFLEKGRHFVVASFKGIGRSHIVFAEKGAQMTNQFPLAMDWYRNGEVLQFDVSELLENNAENTVFVFTAPPAAQRMVVPCDVQPSAIVDGIEYAGVKDTDGCWRIDFPSSAMPRDMQLVVKNFNGKAGGAVIDERIKFVCGKGEIKSGDWSKIDGLASYSGGAQYSQSFEVGEGEIDNKMFVEISDLVSSAEVFVNGQSAGVKVAPPWNFDITGLAKCGSNELEILIHNTLANQYISIPTKYRGELTSGLLGNVRIAFYAGEEMDGRVQ